MIKQCVVCDGEFEARNNTYKCCSPGCSKEYNLRADRRRNTIINLTPDLREKKRARQRAHYHRNIEDQRIRGRAKYWKNPEVEREKRRESKRKYRSEQPDRARAAEREYRQRTRDERRQYEQNYRNERAAALKLIRELQSKGMEALL